MPFIYIIAIILIVIIILAAAAPKSYDVSRSIIINRPRKEVFEYLRVLRNYETWSPWHKKDPDMKLSYEGIDGEEGSISRWEGNKEVGMGNQTIVNIEANDRIDSDLVFLKPWQSQSKGYYIFDDVDSAATKVTWGFQGTNKFPATVFMLFYNMDKVVGKDFEEGLMALKNILENG